MFNPTEPFLVVSFLYVNNLFCLLFNLLILIFYHKYIYIYMYRFLILFLFFFYIGAKFKLTNLLTYPYLYLLSYSLRMTIFHILITFNLSTICRLMHMKILNEYIHAVRYSHTIVTM